MLHGLYSVSYTHLDVYKRQELRTENTKGDGSYGSLYGDYLVYKDGQLQLKNGLPVEENGDWGYLGVISIKLFSSIILTSFKSLLQEKSFRFVTVTHTISIGHKIVTFILEVVIMITSYILKST